MRAQTFGNRFLSEFRRLGGSTRNSREAGRYTDEPNRRGRWRDVARVV